eukprot:190118_1
MFTRFLVNSLLNSFPEVAYLETDIGQSEFTPTGFVSLNVVSTPLFGTPSTHLRQPLASVYVGDCTPSVDVDLYARACAQGFRMYSRKCAHLPLVVNTQGWVRGVGLDLLNDLIGVVKPSDIIQITGSESPDKLNKTPLKKSIVSPPDYPARMHSICRFDKCELQKSDHPIVWNEKMYDTLNVQTTDDHLEQPAIQSSSVDLCVGQSNAMKDISSSDCKLSRSDISAMSCDNTASNITSDANVNPSDSKISSDSGSACLEHNINPNGSCHTKLPSPQTTNSTDLATSLSQIDHKSSNRPIAASHRPKKKNAQSLRLLSMEAYFRQVGREQTQKTRLSVHLASSRPYVVPFRSVEICFLHEQVQSDHILNALNGTIVALAARNSDISE